jgi:hypothetical protein
MPPLRYRGLVFLHCTQMQLLQVVRHLCQLPNNLNDEVAGKKTRKTDALDRLSVAIFLESSRSLIRNYVTIDVFEYCTYN